MTTGSSTSTALNSKPAKAPVRRILSRTRKQVVDSALPLWEHQRQTLKFALQSPVVFDTSDPGTGKTRAHLEAFQQRWQVGSSAKCLILAPKSLLRTAWFQDASKFTPELKCVIAYATNREKAFNEPADVYITNLDAVKWLIKQPKTWLTKHFPANSTLIVDEITAYKHRTSQRTKAAIKLSEHFAYRVGLTGTPNPRSVTELWAQLFVLDHGAHLGKNFFQFRGATQTPTIRGAFTTWEDKPGIELAVAQIIADVSVRHEFEKCLSIPPNHTYQRTFTPSEGLLSAYEEMRETCLLELEKGTIKAVNAAVLQNKLLQILSGASYSDEDYLIINTDRYELIADLIEEVQHSVCFFNWRHQKDLVSKHLTDRDVSHAVLDGSIPIKQRESIVTAYQRGELQTVLLHPQTGAHGLTLTKGTRTIWSSPIFQADFLVQGRHRIYRGGQTQRTETILVCAENTIEEQIYNRLNGREQTMNNFLEMLKEGK